MASSWTNFGEVTNAQLAATEHAYFQRFITTNQYYDLFLINLNGDIFYTVTKVADYKTNLLNGPYKESGLGRLFSQTLVQPQFNIVDFEPYAPSNNDPAEFIAQPLIQNGEVKGVIALQLSIKKINKLM